MKNKKIFFCVVLLMVFALVVSIRVSSAQQVVQASLDSDDAIGVRIVPNPEHYSIARWYKNQGFSGSPQALTVDGYEAIRDGRTVYVNAANIKVDSNNQNNRLIYTNIYLISYNQNPSAKTIDILGQIVKNWKFNADLQENTALPATCSIAIDICASDADCGSNQFCAPASSAQANTCQLKERQNCSFDSDCPKGFFCDSVKAKIIRDVKRVGQAVEITEALDRYYSSFGGYPKLSAGSYLSGQTLSLWPSWSANFLAELSLPANFVDPINRLGYCPGFDRKTCWSASSSRFYQPSGSTAGTSLILPANSYAYSYQANEGKKFSFCSTLETAVNKTGLNFQFSPPSVAGSCVVDGLSNTSPRFVSARLEGETGQEFVGWVEFVDDQDNLMTWNMSLTGSNWKKNLSFGRTENTWKTNPILQNTNNPNQKKIYAPQAPEPGKYQVRLDVSDGQSATTTKFLDIVISNTKPFIEAENVTYRLRPDQPLVYSFYFSDDNLGNYQTAYNITKISGSNSSFDPLLSSSADLKKTIEAAGANRYKVSYEYKIPTTFKFNNGEEYNYKLTVADKYGDTSFKDIKININNDVPSLEFNCLSGARLGAQYSCLLGPKKQPGAGNQNLNYTFEANFTSLMIDYGVDPDYVILKSDNTRANDGSASGTIKIKVANEYGGFSEKSFGLQLNTYCGDGVKQMPNDEKRGGIYNDGYEDCDGESGIVTGANRVASSSISNQYACATFDSNTPYPIPNNGYCVYKSPVNGGGFCGDGYCQVKDEKGNNLENYDNCRSDCLHLCQPNCANKSCGDDGCGGSCGSCNIVGEECYGGNCCSNQGTVNAYLFNDPVIMGGKEDAPAIFFNDKKYELSYVSASTYSVKVPVEHGKNVLAVDAQIENFSNGISVSLDHCSRQPISPDNIKNVKCVNSVASAKDWFKKDYNDTIWSKANLGYSDGHVSIWANDYDSSHKRLINAYCRYTFTGDDSSGTNCTSDPSNKECGANSCGSNYRPNDCIAVKGSNNYFCSNNVCSCQKKTCADYGDTSGREGSVCGPLSDGCGGTIDCGYNPVDSGLYCLMSYESKSDDPSLLYYTQMGKGGDYQFLQRRCHIGKPVNTYQRKCWDTSFSRSINVRQGDIPDTTKCSVEKVDNPKCTDNPDPTCPTQCSTKTLTSNGLDGDSCWTQNMFSSFFGFWESWTPRKEWRCLAETAKKIWYYGDICFADTGDKVLNDGTCGPCQPDCSGKQCGASDGCDGFCQAGTCPDNQRCSNGACVACNCETTFCGEKNACGSVCSSGGVCPPGYSCGEGLCQEVKIPGYCVGTSDVIGDCSLVGANNPDECASFTGCTWTENCEPSCSGKNCGADGCGGTCGNCATGQYCQSGICATTCTPSCTGKKFCGADNGCGGKCSGLCIKGYECINGSCEKSVSQSETGVCVGSSQSCSTKVKSHCLAKNGCTWVASYEK